MLVEGVSLLGHMCVCVYIYIRELGKVTYWDFAGSRLLQG